MKQGHFGVELVDEEDDRVYQEHAKGDGQTYAEVEPDREYCIRLISNAPQDVSVTVEIDGETLEKGRPLGPRSTCKTGLWGRDSDGNLEMMTLKFDKAKNYEKGSTTRAPKFWTGAVKVHFYGNPKFRIPEPMAAAVTPSSSTETSPTQLPVSPRDHRRGPLLSPLPSKRNNVGDLRDFDDECGIKPVYESTPHVVFPEVSTRHDVSNDVGFLENISDRKRDKGVKSVKGQTVVSTFKAAKPAPVKAKVAAAKRSATKSTRKETSTRPKKKPVVLEAVFLGTITLKYCTAEGLIRAGILPEPPNWRLEKAREHKPREDNWKELSEKRVTYEDEGIRNANGVFRVTRVHEVFDLIKEESNDNETK